MYGIVQLTMVHFVPLKSATPSHTLLWRVTSHNVTGDVTLQQEQHLSGRLPLIAQAKGQGSITMQHFWCKCLLWNKNLLLMHASKTRSIAWRVVRPPPTGLHSAPGLGRDVCR